MIIPLRAYFCNVQHSRKSCRTNFSQSGDSKNYCTTEIVLRTIPGWREILPATRLHAIKLTLDCTQVSWPEMRSFFRGLSSISHVYCDHHLKGFEKTPTYNTNVLPTGWSCRWNDVLWTDSWCRLRCDDFLQRIRYRIFAIVLHWQGNNYHSLFLIYAILLCKNRQK